MPPRTFDEWAKKVYKMKPQEPNLNDLADWIETKLISRNLAGRMDTRPTEKQDNRTETTEDAGDTEPLPSDMEPLPNDTPVQSEDEASFIGTTRPNNSVTLLPVVPMKVHGANGKTIEVYGLLDQGSEVTLIDAQDVEKLQLEGKTRTSQFRTFHEDDPVLQVK